MQDQDSQRPLRTLRSQRSLCRLQGFGGVLHYQEQDASMQRYYGINSSSVQAGPVPVSASSATASLDRNASCSRIDAAATTATGRGGIINKQADNDSDDDEQASKFETPVKAIANMEILRALRLLDKQDGDDDDDDDDEIVHTRPLLRYPAHLSKTAPSNETDHQLGQGPATDSTQASSSATGHSATVLEAGTTIMATVSPHNDEDFEDRQRLAREISQDMDQGGYASLEQILARNGFQVCRVATPPSSGAARVRSRATHPHLEDPNQHHHATSSAQSVVTSANVADASTTAIVAGNAGLGLNTAGGLETRAQPATATTSNKRTPPSSDARHGTIAKKFSGSHPLAKVLSNSTQSSGTNGTLDQSVRVKPSLMSFTGLVSSLWGGGGAATPSVHIQAQPGAHNFGEPAFPPSPISPAGVDSADSSRDLGEDGTASIDRDEHIKGWLRQTVEATNQYMSEAKRQIEAARLAMGSPEAVRSRPSKLDEGEDDVMHKVFVSHLPESSTEGTAEVDRSHPDREGTQSTIESDLVETPTTSPAYAASRTYDVRVVHSPLSSPPLLRQQLRQDTAPHLVDAVACDSPLRQRALLARQNKAQQDQETKCGSREIQYPPRDARTGIADIGNEGEKKAVRPRSAETLLRGTLRHALSEASMRTTQTPQVEPASPAQLPRHPSIASIFGIPLARTAAPSPVQAPQSAENVAASDSRARSRPNVVRSDSNKLSESTNSLSTENASSRACSSSAAQTASTAPKLLRKTASKHTLRKAASPVLSTTAVESYGDAAETPSPPPPPVPEVPVGESQKKQEQQRSHVAVYQDSLDRTPVKNRAVRGPIPVSSASRTSTAADESSSSTPSRTPRQVAHRNPRDSPVGETRVVKSPPGKRFASVLSNSRNVNNAVSHQLTGSTARQKATAVGSIMDDENEGSGMWMPPPSSKTAPRKTVPAGDIAAKKHPLGETRPTKQHGNNTSGVGTSQKPRLKAKQSLEHILAAQQAQAAAAASKTPAEAPPSVPVIPADLQSKGTTKDADLPARPPKKVASNDGVDRLDKGTTASKAGFTSTLRGFFGSATNALAQNAVTFTTLRGPREAPTHSSKPTHQLRLHGGAPVIRRAKSMYARPGSAGSGDRPPKDSWPSAQERYSLILPTIVISGPTNDSDALSL